MLGLLGVLIWGMCHAPYDAHIVAPRLSTRRDPISLRKRGHGKWRASWKVYNAFLSPQHFGQIGTNNELSLRAR